MTDTTIATPSAAGPRPPRDDQDSRREDRHRLSVPGGLAALSLDAMASVAYGPEAIVLVLALGGATALGFTVPVTLTIAALLLVLTLSYRQVIAAFPDGGGRTAWHEKYEGEGADDQDRLPAREQLSHRPNSSGSD